MTCWAIICTYVELRKFVKVALCTWQDVISLSRAVSTQNWPPAILCLARIAKSIISATNKRYNICFLWEWILRVLTLHGCNIVVSSNFIRTEKYIFVFYECTFELILNVNSVTVLQLQIKLKKYTSAWTGCDSAGAQCNSLTNWAVAETTSEELRSILSSYLYPCQWTYQMVIYMGLTA